MSPALKASAAEIEVPRSVEKGCRVERFGEGVGAGGAVDQPPRHHHLLLPGARPLHIGEGDPPNAVGAHRADEVAIADGLHVAGALEQELVALHRRRDVDGDHQHDVDGNGLGATGDGRQATGERHGGNRPGCAGSCHPCPPAAIPGRPSCD